MMGAVVAAEVENEASWHKSAEERALSSLHRVRAAMGRAAVAARVREMEGKGWAAVAVVEAEALAGSEGAAVVAVEGKVEVG